MGGEKLLEEPEGTSQGACSILWKHVGQCFAEKVTFRGDR